MLCENWFNTDRINISIVSIGCPSSERIGENKNGTIPSIMTSINSSVIWKTRDCVIAKMLLSYVPIFNDEFGVIPSYECTDYDGVIWTR